MDNLNIFICNWNIAVNQHRKSFYVRSSVFVLNLLILLYDLGLCDYYLCSRYLIYVFWPKKVKFVRVSRPGLRVFKSVKQRSHLPNLIYIFSDCRGDLFVARPGDNIAGGELLLEIHL